MLDSSSPDAPRSEAPQALRIVVLDIRKLNRMCLAIDKAEKQATRPAARSARRRVARLRLSALSATAA